MLLLLALMSSLPGGSGAWLDGYELTVKPSSVSVQEGLCVLVSCSFSYPEDSPNSNPVYGYWFKEPINTEYGAPVATNDPARNLAHSAEGRFRLEGDPRKKNCTLRIRDTHWWDEGHYFFRVEKEPKVKYNFKGSKFHLTVTGLTQKPDIFIPETLVAGQPVTALCVFNWGSEQCPAPAFSWAGSALDSEGTRVPGAPYSTLRLTPRPQDQDSELTCRVDFRSRLSAQRTVRLSVTYSPQHLVISISQDNGAAQEIQENIPHVEVQKGQLLQLFCAADSRPPATLTWELGGRVISQSPPSGPRPLRLELPRVKPEDAGRYTCRAESSLGSKHRTLDISVQYPPEDLRVTVVQVNSTVLEILGNGTSLPILEGQSLRLVCVTHSKPPARLSWARGTQALSPLWTSEPGVLELPQVQQEHEGEVTCHAENPLGTRSVSLRLSVHYAPQLLGPTCSWEAAGLHCRCSSRAWPVPSLRWQLGQGLLEGNSSNASFTVTSNSAGPWANSSLSLHGGLNSSLRLSCESWNTHGAPSTAVLLLPDETPRSATFSKGVLVGVCSMALLSLCVILLMKVRRTTHAQEDTQEDTPGPKFSRRSTILDYINVVPRGGPLAQNRKAKASSPSQIPSPETQSPRPKKNRPKQPLASPGIPEPKMSTGPPDSEVGPDGLHYATVNFSGLRPWETQAPKGNHEDYAEIKFCRGSLEF